MLGIQSAMAKIRQGKKRKKKKKEEEENIGRKDSVRICYAGRP